MRIWIAVGVFSSLLLAARAAHAGACAPQGWEPALITPSTVTVPKNGAILVGIQNGSYREGQDKTNPAVTKLTLVQGGKKIPLTAEDLAPGLARYRWGKKKLAAGEYELRDAAGKSLGKVKIGGATTKPLPAPKLASVHAYSHKSQPEPGEPGWAMTYHYVTAKLSEAVPPTALGLILYQGGTAGLFARVSSATKSLVPMHSSGGRCALSVPKANPPAGGAAVTAAYIDQHGQLSATTPELTVSTSAPKTPPAITSPPPPPPPPPPGTTAKASTKPETKPAPKKKAKKKGCSAGSDQAPWSLGLLLALGLIAARRQRRQRDLSFL